jgi:hypothetical protein
MTIEAKLDRIVELLEALVHNKYEDSPAAGSTSYDDLDAEPARPARGRKAAADKESGKGKAKKAPTMDELRNAAKEYIDAHGTGEFKTVLGRFGIKKLPEADEGQYTEIMEMLKAGPKAANGGSDNDDLV